MNDVQSQLQILNNVIIHLQSNRSMTSLSSITKKFPVQYISSSHTSARIHSIISSDQTPLLSSNHNAPSSSAHHSLDNVNPEGVRPKPLGTSTFMMFGSQLARTGNMTTRNRFAAVFCSLAALSIVEGVRLFLKKIFWQPNISLT